MGSPNYAVSSAACLVVIGSTYYQGGFEKFNLDSRSTHPKLSVRKRSWEVNAAGMIFTTSPTVY